MLGFTWSQSIERQSDNQMDLLEYQAKTLFRSIGIPVLDSQRINRIQDLKNLSIPYPIVLKSQVHVSGRGRLGGIRFVDNTIDAIAAAQILFNLSIMGQKPVSLLAEKKFNGKQEFYLAVTLNRSLRRIVLLGSTQGGDEVRSAIGSTQQVVVEGEFSPFYARRLSLKMGLEGSLMTAVSQVVEKMYYLLVEKDLDLVEINPLGVSETGEMMALDGKVIVNNGALGRHPDLAALAPEPSPTGYAQSQDQADNLNKNILNKSILNKSILEDSICLEEPRLTVQSTLETQGIVGLLCNGSGLTMATMDSFYQAGGKPIAFLNIGSDTHHCWDVQTFCDRLLQGLKLLSKNAKVEIIVMNLISGIVPGEAIAQTLLQFLGHPTSSCTPNYSSPNAPMPNVPMPNAPIPNRRRLPKLIIRWIGPEGDRMKALLTETTIAPFDELEPAIAEVLKQVKVSKTFS